MHTHGMSEMVALVGMVISVLAAVVSMWFARKNNVRGLREELDILSEWTEKAVRASRTARMREVRAATRENAPGTGFEPPPELKQPQLPLGGSPAEVKKALRQRVFGRGTPTH